jgi:hypothetical protein
MFPIFTDRTQSADPIADNVNASIAPSEAEFPRGLHVRAK